MIPLSCLSEDLSQKVLSPYHKKQLHATILQAFWLATVLKISPQSVINTTAVVVV